MTEPRVLMVHPAGGLTLVPPVKFSDWQISLGHYAGTRLADGSKSFYRIPFEKPDLLEIFNALPETRTADVLIHWCMPGMLLRNVAAFPGRKVLILGDTQHGPALREILAYATEEHYDHIFAEKRQHAHWFAEAGAGLVHWLPGIVADPQVKPFNAERRREIVVVGHTNKSHALRRRYIDALAARGYPLRHVMCPPEEAASYYNSALITLNVSLNGDANLRFFEVPAAGGFLLTDRLAELAGVGAFYQEGKHYDAFNDFDDLCAKLDHYLANPNDAFRIAQRAQHHYATHLTRATTVARFWQVVNDGVEEPGFSLVNEPRLRRPISSLAALKSRLDVYEAMQEVNRTGENAKVLLLPDVSPQIASDCADLHRLSLYVLDSDTQSVDEAVAFGLEGYVRRISSIDAGKVAWDAIIGKAGTNLDVFTASRKIAVA